MTCPSSAEPQGDQLGPLAADQGESARQWGAIGLGGHLERVCPRDAPWGMDPHFVAALGQREASAAIGSKFDRRATVERHEADPGIPWRDVMAHRDTSADRQMHAEPVTLRH